MASIRDLIELQKYQQGYKADGPQANYSSVAPTGMLNPNRNQATALKLLQYQAMVEKAQAEAQIAQRKKQLWDSVGTPVVSDKSTAGDVTEIVNDEEVGGRDANVVNSGEDLSYLNNYQNGQSNSKVANMVAGLQPTISSRGDMVLSRPRVKKASADSVSTVKGTGTIKDAIKAAVTMGTSGAADTQTSDQSYKEGQTAVNPKTGQRLQFKGGKWHSLN